MPTCVCPQVLVVLGVPVFLRWQPNKRQKERDEERDKTRDEMKKREKSVLELKKIGLTKY